MAAAQLYRGEIEGELAAALDVLAGLPPTETAVQLPLDVLDEIEDVVALEADADVDELTSLQVHGIKASPGGLMGIEFTYELTAMWR